jgi:hypothetical protein
MKPPPDTPPKVRLRRREVKRADGRYLIYYEFSPARSCAQTGDKPCRS